MMGVVRLPGSPPTQCLSTTMPAGHSQPVAGLNHRMGERKDFLVIERARRAGGQKR